MAIKPAIVICAFNRPASLERLLQSLAKAHYPEDDISLVISIDKSETDAVQALATSFEWPYGTKKIIAHTQHLGLKEHVLRCGDLSLEYSAIIVLEDDLLVSPWYYLYAAAAANFYADERKIAGVSLYNYEIAESCFYPFKAVDDGTDVYFIQVASSWGQLWTQQQWQTFRQWFTQNPNLTENHGIPAYISEWGSHSWKKHFIHYLISTDSYFVFPRLSLTTNFGEPGTNADQKNVFQVSLQLSFHDYLFCSFADSQAIYDAWFEILPQCLNLHNQLLKTYTYQVDLYGTKQIEQLNAPHVLTSKTGITPLLSFSSELFPPELNVALNLKGSQLALYELRQNSFSPAQLKLCNPMWENKKEDLLGITIIIPLLIWDAENLQLTLNSIAAQTFTNRECIIVSPKAISADEKNRLLRTNKLTRVIETNADLQAEQLFIAGCANASKGIICYLEAGSTFVVDSLNKAAGIFSSHSQVCWLRGINETTKNVNDLMRLNVRPYRLNPGETYRQLRQGAPDASLDLNFIRAHCLKTLSADLFYELIGRYQLTIAVFNFGTKKVFSSKTESKKHPELLTRYAHLAQKPTAGSRIADLAARFFFSKSTLHQWLYPTLNNFPDVLRFDAVFNTFYFSKR